MSKEINPPPSYPKPPPTPAPPTIAMNFHGASGMCCPLREFEKNRAEKWKRLALDARCVLNAHAIGYGTQRVIEKAEKEEGKS